MDLSLHSEERKCDQLVSFTDLTICDCYKQSNKRKLEKAKYELCELLDKLVQKTGAKGGRLLHGLLQNREGFETGLVKSNGTITKNEQRLLIIGQNFIKEDLFVQPIHHEGRFAGVVYLYIDPSEWRAIFAELVQAYVDLTVQNLSIFSQHEVFEQNTQTLNQKKKELEKLQEYNQNLLRITAHDLSSPLNAVSGYLEMIKHALSAGENSEKLRQYYKHIESGVNDVSEMLKQLNEVVKYEKGSLSLQTVKADANWLVKEVCKVLHGSAADKSISLHVLVNDEPAFIEADIIKFKRVVYNLISNAIKYSHPYRHIYVKLSSTQKNVYIHVKDEGIGISEGKLDDIFKPFVKLKAENDQAKDYISQGLGLYISSYFTELMGGKIIVESKKGKGSTFTVRMPAAGAATKGQDLAQHNHNVPVKDMPGLPSISQLAFKY